MLASHALHYVAAAAAAALFHSSSAEQHVFTVPAAASVCDSFKSYSALGDSYACGFGSLQRLKLCNDSSNLIQDGFGSTCTTAGCGQDVGGYSWRFREQHKIPAFQYLACNGIDTGDVIKVQIDSPGFGSDPDLVTVNMGGDNRSFFAHVVQSCIVLYDHSNCTTAMSEAASIINDDLPREYAKVFSALRKKLKPEAKVVAMGYAQFWDRVDATDCVYPLDQATPDEKRYMNDLARNMSRILEEQSHQAGYLFGDVDSKFEGARLCSKAHSYDSLFQTTIKLGWDTAGKFYTEVSLAHPTLKGQDLMLDVLNGALGC